MTENKDEGFRATAGMVRGLLEGFVLPLAGARLLWQTPKARRQALYPLIANTLVYALVVVLGFWIINRVNLDPVQWEFWWGIGATLASAVNYLLPIVKWLICVPLLLAFCYFTFTFVGMLIAGPFNDLLSETLEHKLTGQPMPEQSWREMAHSMAVSLWSTLRILLKQGLCALCCLPLLLIPVAGAALMFLVMAYFTGLCYLDVAMARNNLRYRHKMVAAKDRRWILIGCGSAMQFLLLIPLVGLLVLPVGVSSGTLLYCRMDWRKLLADATLTPPEGFSPPICRDNARP